MSAKVQASKPDDQSLDDALPNWKAARVKLAASRNAARTCDPQGVFPLQAV